MDILILLLVVAVSAPFLVFTNIIGTVIQRHSNALERSNAGEW